MLDLRRIVVTGISLSGLVLSFSPAFAFLAYVSNEKGNSISVIDTEKMETVATIKTGQRPRGIEVTRDGSRKVAIFADPLCPYCQMLEREMQGVTNVTVYTFLYPIESLHPGASVKSVEIWCSKDRSSAWSK